MQDISVTELKKRMDAGEKLFIIDVRESHEFEEFNNGAQLIPLSELPDKLAEYEKYKNDEIIVHCRSGMRSNNAKMYMIGEGFTHVRNLIGGMMAWQSEID